MTEPKKHWNLKTCAEQLEWCEYECEAGSLKMNDAFLWLKQAAEIGPEFLPGQGVYYQITADVCGEELTKWTHFYIVGCRMSSDTESRIWLYNLSNDPPRPWHYGSVQFQNVEAGKLFLEIPNQPIT